MEGGGRSHLGKAYRADKKREVSKIDWREEDTHRTRNFPKN